MSNYCIMVPVLCVHLTQEWIPLTICSDRGRNRESKRMWLNINHVLSVWKQMNNSWCFLVRDTQSQRWRERYFLSHENSVMLIVCFEVITMPRCFCICSLLISFHSSGKLQHCNIISWWCILSFGAPMCWVDCKLILLDGMSIFLTFKPQGVPDTLAARTECMHYESAETDMYQHSLKIVSEIFSFECQMSLRSRRLAGTAIDRCLICLAWISLKLISAPYLSLELRLLRQFTSFQIMCRLWSVQATEMEVVQLVSLKQKKSADHISRSKNANTV